MHTDPLSPGGHTAPLPPGSIHYTVQGSGPLCVVLPGGPGMHPNYVGDLGGLDAFLTLLVMHPLITPCRPMPATWPRCSTTSAAGRPWCSATRTAA